MVYLPRRSARLRSFDYGEFGFGQAVELVHEAVDFGVGSVNLPPDRPALGFGLGRSKLLMLCQHRIDHS